jgi:hypothetical protein
MHPDDHGGAEGAEAITNLVRAELVVDMTLAARHPSAASPAMRWTN